MGCQRRAARYGPVRGCSAACPLRSTTSAASASSTTEFQDLVIARIVEATSKIDALPVLNELGANPLSYKIIHHLTLVVTDGHRDRIPWQCFA